MSTPAYVAYLNNEVLIGGPALAIRGRFNHSCVHGIKDLIGLKYDEELITKFKNHYTVEYEITKGDEDEIILKIGEIVTSPEEVL